MKLDQPSDECPSEGSYDLCERPRLLRAIEDNDDAEALKALEDGVNINEADENSFRRDGCTALHLAAKHNNLALTKILIERGANIDAVNHVGHTALRIAADNCHFRIVQFLLTLGANPSIQDRLGVTVKRKITKVVGEYIAILEVISRFDHGEPSDSRVYATDQDRQ